MPMILCKASASGSIVLRPQARPRWYPVASVEAAAVEVWEHDADEPRSAARLVGTFRPGDKGSVPFNPETDRNKILYTVARSPSGTPDVSSLADAVSATVLFNRDTEAPLIEQIGEATKDMVTVKIPVTRFTRRREIEIYDTAGMSNLLQSVTRDAGEATLPDVEDISRVIPVTLANVALTSAGATATASQADAPATNATNGDRTGKVGSTNFVWWEASAPGDDTLEVAFPVAKTIKEVVVVTVQDNFGSPVEPDEALTFILYGLTSYVLQYWTGSAWAEIPGTDVTGNNKVLRRFAFAPITTTKVRVVARASPDGGSRVVEFEAYEETANALPQTIHVRARQSGGGTYGAWSALKELMFASEGAPGSSGGAELITRGKINLEEPI